MTGIPRPKDVPRLRVEVTEEGILHLQHGQEPRRAERHSVAGSQAPRDLLFHGERDRKRPGQAAGEVHLLNHTAIDL
jgi:hypothetical protein